MKAHTFDIKITLLSRSLDLSLKSASPQEKGATDSFSRENPLLTYERRNIQKQEKKKKRRRKLY